MNRIQIPPLKHATSSQLLVWYVRVAWPNGKHEHIPGFVSQQEAQCLIEGKAPAWLAERCNTPQAAFIS
jgi:hypothetical protein